eukprot:TRINITY_DN82585_c0_g1_i1.p1 TRINITY_DN82585_c0_g1~~TRINITY_DN82585_c0_g1_i1.p1  ORF type:complete len:175 (+),score=36.11 TRINITY_DN82585_c0_g1_i1:22-525(+)
MAVLACSLLWAWLWSRAAGQDASVHKAAREGDLNKLLRAGAPELKQRGDGGQTALIAASVAGHAEAVYALLRRGSNASELDHGGSSAMYSAARLGHFAVIATLLDHGAEAEAAVMHEDGHYPLHRACMGDERGHTKSVKILIEVTKSKDTKNWLEGFLKTYKPASEL